MAKITVALLLDLQGQYSREEISFSRMVELLNEKASEPEWISVSDCLPKEGQEVLFFNDRIYNMKGEPYSSDVHGGFHFKGYFKTWLSQDKMKATHWMPLPNKPV